MTKQYAHVLLFACPDCDSPIAISLVTNERNLESTDGQSMRVFCTHCYNSSYVTAVMAKKHYVDDWP